MRRLLPSGLSLLTSILALLQNSATFAYPDHAPEADRASRGVAKGAIFGAIVGDSKSARRGAVRRCKASSVACAAGLKRTAYTQAFLTLVCAAVDV